MSFAIFLSPSEEKILDSKQAHSINNQDFLDSLWQSHFLNNHRHTIYHCYKQTLQEILTTSNTELLQEIYGAKHFNAKNEFEINYALAPNHTIQAIECYNGVAFKALNFHSLSTAEQSFILQHVFIFSNLFGVVRACDFLPFYKLKQGTKYTKLSLQTIYKPFLPILESFVAKQEFIIDLRAEIYTKIFALKQRNFFFRFQKNGKAISHYAKMYRGKILGLLAQAQQDCDFHSMLEFLQNIHNDEFAFHALIKQQNTNILEYRILE